MSLLALSPLDGRYAGSLTAVAQCASEFGLIRARLRIEIEWLKVLGQALEWKDFDRVSARLDAILEGFTAQEAEKVKAIERTTAHDVKAVEYYLKQCLEQEPAWVEYIHFGCTSEDINNLAYGAILLELKHSILLPSLHRLLEQLIDRAHQYSAYPMLSRTHGQPASPTTVGKEFANTASRLRRQIEALEAQPILGKFNGAVGNFNAHALAYPDLPWQTLSDTLILSLGLEPNHYTTQIEPHDGIAEYCHILSRIHTILIDFARNQWGYVSLGYFTQAIAAHEVGSSTMPHKVNPIDFENAEGNFGIANALLTHFSEKLPISRFQRDLSDSTVLRNLGSAIGYGVLGYGALLKGLSKITPHRAHCEADLNAHIEVLGEAIQTVMRRYGLETPYEQLKTLTRGKTLTLEALRAFIQAQPLPPQIQAELLALTPSQYLGYAVELAKSI
jgi:adenylosuccinate lyase